MKTSGMQCRTFLQEGKTLIKTLSNVVHLQLTYTYSINFKLELYKLN